MKSLSRALSRAIRKRDKWSKRVLKLEAALQAVGETLYQPNMIQPQLATSDRKFPLSEEDLKRFQPRGLFFGAAGAVGRSLELPAYKVMRVARGLERNPQIEASLAQELVRREATGKNDNSPFTKEQLAQFGIGGRYFGLIAEVAKATNVSSSFPGAVAKGRSTSPRILAALIDGMRRRDEAIVNGGNA